ncbi:MAG TPA: peptidyl-tRNA hydrolase Pth2 [Candidatus Methanomethylicus sp.]|jgi:PTH2 family peptidyl-tRNA hydrolase|nr:peptidyl-tRNA hydrolase Pth2 [Candidatus Methanomethylicus sp.]HRU80986.1 peptidyl-tRNA hydrolase Pth2 [Candidatus Methanomethylicus sp.]
MDFQFKQAIIVRQDLKMSKGKVAAQAGHAAVSSYVSAKRRKPDWADYWLQEGQKKVALKVGSLDDLLNLKKDADLDSLPNALIEDAGLTELEPGTVTCLGIGPAPSAYIDRIAGRLKLL